jgi:hypothetical protein
MIFNKENVPMSSPEERIEKLFGGQQQQSKGILAAIKETALAIAPGLKDMIPQARAELKQMGAHGAHELAAALFSGSAYVMYPRGANNQPSQEQSQDGPATQNDDHGHHLERGGRGM